MNHAIIVGAGKSTRMDSSLNKIFLNIVNKPLIYHTLKQFEDSKLINKIILVTSKENLHTLWNLVKQFNLKKISKIVEGGKHRQDSVYNGIKSLKAKKDDIIVIHNAANPLVTQKTITDCINAAKKHGASVAGFPAKDTIKKVNNNFVVKTLNRADLVQVQTPQCIKYDLALKAFESAKKDKFYSTDDTALVERLGYKVKIVPCPQENIKITTQKDLETVKNIISNAKVGLGHDSHKFSNKKPLTLGTLTFKNQPKLQANSDGDVLLHALFNAITQSIGKKSIGYYCDDLCLNLGIKDSKEYIKLALKILKQENYKINNIGIMIEAQKPKLDPHVDKMKDNLAKLLAINKNNIGITVTSGEDLTPFGKGLAIQCFAIVSVIKCN